MASLARRLVSRGKRRFRDAETGADLDLSYITDRLLIMGWPGEGLTTLWRNPRSEVLKFLESRHGSKWNIYNFCPRAENSYDADSVHGQVTRFPFPDHHAPPLSLIPLFVEAITKFQAADAGNVAVIHCKAGKGRSGSMTCCYLLSMPTLPGPPQDAGSYPSGQAPSISTDSVLPEHTSERGRSDSANAFGDANVRQRAERLTSHLTDASDAGLTEEPAEGEEGTEVAKASTSAAAESADIAEKLRFVFQLHTDRRMQAAKEGKYGVSIASQRRFVGYWARILNGDDPRPWLQPDMLRNGTIESTPKRKIRLTKLVLTMADKLKGVPPPLNTKRVSVVVSRYEDDYVADVERREWQLRKRRLDEKEGRPTVEPEIWSDDQWRDKGEMFNFCGRLVQGAEGQDGSGTRTLMPKEEDDVTVEGIELDADRQVLLKILVGQTGTKHNLLPDVAALGYAWMLPSFEGAVPGPGEEFVWKIRPDEVDFLKPQAGLTEMAVHFVGV